MQKSCFHYYPVIKFIRNWKVLYVVDTANTLIENYIISQNNITFIDIFHPMLNKEGKPRTELFIDDMLHMNRKGYKIWRKKLKRHLIKK